MPVYKVTTSKSTGLPHHFSSVIFTQTSNQVQPIGYRPITTITTVTTTTPLVETAQPIENYASTVVHPGQYPTPESPKYVAGCFIMICFVMVFAFIVIAKVLADDSAYVDYF